MKKTLRMLLLVLVLCLGLVMPAAAETTDGFASDHICMADMAGVLNEREVTELETMIDEIRTRQKFDIAILTVSEEDIPSVQEYADDIYDGADMGYGETRDGVLLVVDLKSSECYMSTKGYGITVFTDAGIQYVGQQMRPELADGNEALTRCVRILRVPFAHLPHCVMILSPRHETVSRMMWTRFLRNRCP